MISTIPSIRPYDPNRDTKPILWMRTPLLNNLILGKNEKAIKQTPVGSLPPYSVVVKVSRGWTNKQNGISKIGFVQIYFTGDEITRFVHTFVKRENVCLFCDTTYDNLGNRIPTNGIECIQFGTTHTHAKISELTDKLVYINRIIEQLNSI